MKKYAKQDHGQAVAGLLSFCKQPAASHAQHVAHLPCADRAVWLQALLGPSGAGKSTLMDIMAQRKSTGNLSGFLLANGRPTTSSFIRKTAYVPQVGAMSL
jgi:ABC-type cobalamin/Fe3+-siderophores transport system ATPase subunit